jgi:hypothetical protein
VLESAGELVLELASEDGLTAPTCASGVSALHHLQERERGREGERERGREGEMVSGVHLLALPRQDDGGWGGGSTYEVPDDSVEDGVVVVAYLD